MLREWPPPSVWLAAIWLAAPSANLAVWFGVGVVPVGALLGPGLAGGLLLLAGRPAGITLARMQGTLATLVTVPLVVVVAVLATEQPGLGRALPGSVAALAWPLTLFALLRWPEPRRWCGLLPPADPDAAD